MTEAMIQAGKGLAVWLGEFLRQHGIVICRGCGVAMLFLLCGWMLCMVKTFEAERKPDLVGCNVLFDLFQAAVVLIIYKCNGPGLQYLMIEAILLGIVCVIYSLVILKTRDWWETHCKIEK